MHTKFLKAYAWEIYLHDMKVEYKQVLDYSFLFWFEAAVKQFLYDNSINLFILFWFQTLCLYQRYCQDIVIRNNSLKVIH